MNNKIFNKYQEINELIETNKENIAREKLISLLDGLQSTQQEYDPIVNYLLRKVGLYQYIDIKTSLFEERLVAEVFKVDVGEPSPITLHKAQSQILKLLLSGRNLALSAPTSFGKSFIIDAFIAIRRPKDVVIIVPTVALADETRRRLEHKFSKFYKIITTTDAKLSDNNILIFPQERCFSYLDKLDQIDILIVDEFYKVSSLVKDERRVSLLSALVELGKISKQKYYLSPNINNIEDNIFTQGMDFVRKNDFNTVITKYEDVFSTRKKSEPLEVFKKKNLLRILQENQSKTLIYAGSYNEIEKISKILLSTSLCQSTEILHIHVLKHMKNESQS